MYVKDEIKISTYYVDLIYDASLKSFWRKQALRRFLLECDIPEDFLATWSAEETKRQFLDRLFNRLLASVDNGSVIKRIAVYLCEQKSFPDLQNWEDSEKKIKDARDAICKLHLYCSEQEEVITTKKQKDREVFKKRQQEITRSQQLLNKLNGRLYELAKEIGSQKAGYDFEKWFYDLMDFCDITSRRPYNHDGRQIDGSITHLGTTYLIELKFTSRRTNARDIDSFYKKVVTKADNTMGIIVSMSGYSSTAIKNASGDKTPLLLMDYNHLYTVLRDVMSMEDIIEKIRRHASQTSEAYLPVNQFST